MTLLVNSTSVALWHDIIHEAEAACTITLKEDLESYLVFLLMRYVNKPEMVKQIMANEFLEGLQQTYYKRQVAMQDVGDKCLLFSGLFPHIAEKRLVKISYFVNIGQSAYDTLSKQSTDLYGSLSRQFVSLMDILQSIRVYTQKISDLLPFEAYDLWRDTGSKRAFRALKGHTQSLSMPIIHIGKKQ